MSAISAGNQTLLRDSNTTHKSIERLYALGQITVWSGRVNETDPERGLQVITYDGGAMASGFSFAGITEGMLVLFGSSAAASDVGRRALLDISGTATSGTITVDWHNDQQLTDNDYITIIHHWVPWPKYSWFAIEGPEFAKNGPLTPTGAGLDYTDENSTPPPVVVMGYHYANQLPAAGTLAINLDASNSYGIANGATISSYAWTVTGPSGASFDNASSATPVLTITATGKRWVHCTVTDSNGNTSIGHRCFIIGGGITEFSRGEIGVQFNETAIDLQITSTSPDTSDSTAIRPEIDWSDFSKGTLVIIAADETYNTTAGTISSQDDFADFQRVVFSGYIRRRNDDQADNRAHQITLQTIGIIDMYLYSLSLTGVHTPTDWYEMVPDLMTIRGNLHHLFYFHSYLMTLADFRLPSDTVRRSANEEFTEGSLIERARAFCRARLMGMTATPQGEIVVEQDLNVQSEANRTGATTTLTLQAGDTTGQRRAVKRDEGEVLRYTVSGGISQGVLGSYQPVLAGSAGINSSEGRPVTRPIDRLMFASTSEARQFAARLAAVSNYKYAEIVLTMSGNWRSVFDPARQQRVSLGSLFSDNLGGETDLTNTYMIVRDVRHSHDNATGTTEVSIVGEPIPPEGIDGVDLPIPEVPSDDIDTGDYDPPGPPAWPPLEPDVVDDYASTGTLYVADYTNGVYRRLAGAADWVSRNTGLAGDDLLGNQLGFDPWWQQPEKQNSYNVEVSILWYLSGDEDSPSRIWRSLDGGATWTNVTPLTDPPNTWSDSTAPTIDDVKFVMRADNIHQNGHHYFLAEWHNGTDWRTWILKTEDDGATWEWSSFELGDTLSGYDYPGGYSISNPGSKVTVSNDSNLTTPDSMCCLTSTWTDANSFTITLTYGGSWIHDTSNLDIYIKNYSSHSQVGGTNWGTYIYVSDGVTQYLTGVRFVPTNTIYSWIEQEQLLSSATLIPNGFEFDRLILTGPLYGFGKTGTTCLSGIGIRQGSGSTSVLEHRPLWMDVDTEDGTVLWLTMWKGTGGGPGSLYLQKRSTSDFTLSDEWELGSATETEVFTNRTYVAYPYTPAFDKDVCYVYGRMASPAGLSGTHHIIRTVDGGSNFTAVETGFGSDYVGAMQVWDDGGSWHLAFVRNVVAGSTGTFYKGISYSAQGTTPFQVNVDALSQYNGNFAIGAIAAVGGVMVAESTDNGATWNDLTDSLPVDGNIQSVVYV